MTFITWACLRCVQKLVTILGPQNPTQRSCASKTKEQWQQIERKGIIKKIEPKILLLVSCVCISQLGGASVEELGEALVLHAALHELLLVQRPVLVEVQRREHLVGSLHRRLLQTLDTWTLDIIIIFTSTRYGIGMLPPAAACRIYRCQNLGTQTKHLTQWISLFLNISFL